LRDNGGLLSAPRDIHPAYGATYETLEDLASKDDWALVVGLKQTQKESFKPLLIDSVFPKTHPLKNDYPLRTRVFIYRKPLRGSDELSRSDLFNQ